MSYYRTCPHCGAHLDPGEVCDCWEKEKGLPGAVNTEQAAGGKQTLTSSDSTSHDS